MFKRILFTASTTLALTACGDPASLDVGDEKGQVGAALTDYAAQWDGYAQAFAFPGDESDRVRIVLDEEGNGTIRFGNEVLFGEATDPNAWYPPTYQLPTGESRFGVRTGFEFPISGAVVENARLKFSFDPDALMSSWCALQANDPSVGWTCGERSFSQSWNTGTAVCSYSSGQPPVHHELPCARAVQCVGSCSCDESGCHTRDAMQDATFDAVQSDEGETLIGTLLIPSLNDTRLTVVLSR